jgi:hypothetical protein
MSQTLQQQGVEFKEWLAERRAAGLALAERVIRHSAIYQARLGLTDDEVLQASSEHDVIIAKIEGCDLVASTACFPHYKAGEWRTVIMAIGPVCETLGGGAVFLSAMPDYILDRAIRGN